MGDIAFKEWAVVCEALALGRQALILRKGGVAEAGGEFKPEYSRFWLFPTYLHQQQADGIRPEARPLLEKGLAARPADGIVRIRHLVEVRKVLCALRLPYLLELGNFHIWSAETVEKRFYYRVPGLYVLVVQTWELPEPVEIPNLPEYEGCKTWVPLGLDLTGTGLKPCMAPAEVERIAKTVETILHPSATA